jgi:ABC-type multidrug transport system fused ATPase/permease subunit
MAIPWWTREVVRIIEQGGSLSDVRFYALLIIAAAVLQGIVRTYSRALIFNAGRDVEYDLRNDLFSHLEKLPLAFYQANRTGDLMSRVINDISAVRVMLGPGVLNFVNAPVYYVYAVILMLSMDVRMTLAALAPFPLLMIVARVFRGKIMKSSLEVQQQMSVLSSHVQENLSGMHVVKAYSQEDFQTQQFIGLNKDYEVKSMQMAKMRGMASEFRGHVDEMVRQSELDEVKKQLESSPGLDLQSLDPTKQIKSMIQEGVSEGEQALADARSAIDNPLVEPESAPQIAAEPAPEVVAEAAPAVIEPAPVVAEAAPPVEPIAPAPADEKPAKAAVAG